MKTTGEKPPDDFFVYHAKQAFRFFARILKRPVHHRQERKAQARREADIRAARKAQEARIKAELSTDAPERKPTVVFPSPIISDELRDPPVRCPQCGSAHLSANMDGFQPGMAMLGVMAAGPIGLAAGLGSNKVKLTCLKCGSTFWPGSESN